MVLGANGASGDLAVFSSANSGLSGTYMTWTGFSRILRINYVIS